MKVFISWSGERSHGIARALYEWLPTVIQTVTPWLSDQDINKGARWPERLAIELSDTQIGIICLTPENLNSSWILFEAGALSRAQHSTYVCTFLYGLDSTDIEGPLAQFQATLVTEEDIKQLVLDINKFQGEAAVPYKLVETAFERGWKELERILNSIPIPSPLKARARRSERDMLEEILALLRPLSSFQWESRHKSRLVTTLGWPPEDAQMLSEYYQKTLDELEMIRDDYNMSERQNVIKDRINRLETDREFALVTLESLREQKSKTIRNAPSKEHYEDPDS